MMVVLISMGVSICSGFALAYLSEEQGDLLSMLFELGSLF